METYTFIVRVTNSTVIEVNADDINKAHDIAMNKIYDGGYLRDLCNPSDVQIELEIED